MNLNLRANINILGGLLVILAATFVLPALIALENHEIRSAGAFYLMFLLVLCTGLLMRRATRTEQGRLRVRDGFFVVTAAWVMYPFIGSFIYLLSGVVSDFSEAFFEAASGFTTTGATVFENVDALPRSILFWRALSQWMGAFGVLVLASALIPWLNRNRQHVTIESSSQQGKTDPQSDTVTRMICTIYIGGTVLMILIMLLEGYPLFDSMCHTFSTVSTGGFSIYDNGINHFGDSSVMIITIIFMFLAGINYNTYVMTLRHGPVIIRKDVELRVYVSIIIGAAIIMLLCNTYTLDISHETVVDSIFQTVSIMTTTGYTAAECDLWPVFTKALLFALLIIGGCMNSTSGGMKVYRIVVLFKLIKRSFGIRLHPNAVIKIRISDKNLSNDTVIKATSFLFLYISVIFIGSLIISLDNFDLLTSMSSAASCLGNVGPAFGLAGTACTYAMFSGLSKLTFAFLMIAGRLELFTFLAVFTPLFWDPNR